MSQLPATIPPVQPIQPTIARPVIDDAFWFAYSGQVVQNAINSRNTAAANLASILPWLWSVYSASALAVVGISKIVFSKFEIALVVAPVPVLLLAYWCAVWAQAPISVMFDPRIPTAIEQVYDRNVISKNRRLHLALALALLASILVAAAIMCAAFAKNR